MPGYNHSPVKRDVVKGWSAGAVRRHTAWLYSISAPALDGVGFALTLTLRKTPGSAEVFHAVRRSWIRRVERLGASRIHWVIEWQRRGTPHLHLAVYFPSGAVPVQAAGQMIAAWVSLTGDDYGSSLSGQHFDEISGALGWLQYLSKHAARGVKHYQRSGKPAGWEKSGRLWGHTGSWPSEAPMRFDMESAAYWRLRRLVRSWRVAQARSAGDARRIGFARRMLRNNDKNQSSVRGVNDWVSEELLVTFIALLESEGFQVSQRVDLAQS